MNAKITRKDRILKVLEEAGVLELTQLCPRDDKMYPKLYRQLWSKDDSIKAEVSIDVVEYILEKLPDVSADYLVRGEGPMKRTTIFTPPTHRQDIRVEHGGQAAITQSGNASVSGKTDDKTEYFSPDDVANMIRSNDLGGLVAIIMRQREEINKLRMRKVPPLSDASIFPPVC